MAPNQRIGKACKTMKPLGIPGAKVKAALKELLKVYDNQWDLIEDESYRVLIEYILEEEQEEDKRLESKKKDPCLDDDEPEEFEPPLKRLRALPSVNNSNPLSRTQGDEIEMYEACRREDIVECGFDKNGACLDDEPQDFDPLFRRRRLRNKKDQALASDSNSNSQLAESPLRRVQHNEDELYQTSCIEEIAKSTRLYVGDECKYSDVEVRDDHGVSNSLQFDIASSTKSEVKLSLTYRTFGQSDLSTSSLYAILKAVEDECFKTYRLRDLNFSVMKLMREVCDYADYDHLKSINDPPPILDNISNKYDAQDVLGGKIDCRGDFSSIASLSKGSIKIQNQIVVVPQIPKLVSPSGSGNLHRVIGFNINDFGNTHGGSEKNIKEGRVSQSSNSSSMETIPDHHSSYDAVKYCDYVADITKGEERVKISFINVGSVEHLPNFTYIPRNTVYKNAYVNFTLARVADDNCCSECFGDCLSSAIPCACARETDGEFAYTPEGLVNGKFLEKCISISQDPEKHYHIYCKHCPLERSKKKKKKKSKCRGHVVRKFIKECWSKCGCSKKCGNRVVQRGITVNLQVFWTSEGKGWGLRTLEDLPRGAFVCEYVGEIVTNSELDERNMQRTSCEKHTYPVLLDADWATEGVLKDEEALCLDATEYGNVARFINHRCVDATLVEIPVEVETPDHHYYHLAFFTTRKVNAMEELTWDYGIDFDDYHHPVKAFKCRCGSQFCRNKRRS